MSNYFTKSFGALALGVALCPSLMAGHIQAAGNDGAYCLNLQSYGDGVANNVYACGDDGDQTWEVSQLYDNAFRISNTKYGTCLNVQGNDEYTATNVYSCGDSADQTWNIYDSTAGYKQIESTRAPGKCLSLPSAYNEAGTSLKDCDSNDWNQLWNFY